MQLSVLLWIMNNRYWHPNNFVNKCPFNLTNPWDSMQTQWQFQLTLFEFRNLVLKSSIKRYFVIQNISLWALVLELLNSLWFLCKFCSKFFNLPKLPNILIQKELSFHTILISYQPSLLLLSWSLISWCTALSSSTISSTPKISNLQRFLYHL